MSHTYTFYVLFSKTKHFGALFNDNEGHAAWCIISSCYFQTKCICTEACVRLIFFLVRHLNMKFTPVTQQQFEGAQRNSKSKSK